MLHPRRLIGPRTLVALWPAFLMAAVLEGLVFAVVDPAELRWFGGELIGWSAATVYSVTFLIFWGVIGVATLLTALLMLDRGEINEAEAGGEPDRGAGSQPRAAAPF